MANRIRMIDAHCIQCKTQLNTWDARLSKALAYKNPCCEACIAEEYDISKESLRKRMEDYFGIRPCIGA